MQKLRFLPVCFALLAAAPAIAEDLPSRSDCIIGFDMDWSKVNSAPREVVNAFTATGLRIEPYKAMKISPDRSELYLMFSRECDNKAGMAAQIIDHWRSAGLDLPAFTRMAEPIIPSLNTIDVQGPYWRDGQPNGIPPNQFRVEPGDQDI